MSEGILVSGSEAAWGKWLTRGAAAVLLLPAAYLIFQDHGLIAGLLLVVAAVATLIAGEVLAAARLAARRWVVDTRSGLRWIGEPSELRVEDRQVTAVRLAYRRKYAAGIRKHTVRDFDVWVEDRSAPLRMTNRIAVGTADPLGAMIQRICNDLKERAAAGLASGQPLTGDSWSLLPAELTIGQGRTLRAVPFLEIDKVGLFDDKLCIWCKGEDEPAARIAPASRNAPVLAALLGEWVAHQQKNTVAQSLPGGKADPAAVPPGGSGLGKVLFERRKKRMAMYLSLGAFIVLLMGFGLASEKGTRLAGWALMAGFPALVYAAWGWFHFIFRCHERGLYRKWGRRELRIPYTDITQFTYSATRHFHNGAYAGTQFSMKCVAPQGSVGYSAMLNTPDEELDKLRDHIAKVIAGRMFAQLKEGRPVAWTADMSFLPQGLQFRRAAALGLGSKPPEVLPYDQIRAANLKAGVFYLWNQTDSRPVLSKPVSTPNFFPGYFVIAALGQQSPLGGAEAGKMVK